MMLSFLLSGLIFICRVLEQLFECYIEENKSRLDEVGTASVTFSLSVCDFSDAYKAQRKAAGTCIQNAQWGASFSINERFADS